MALPASYFVPRICRARWQLPLSSTDSEVSVNVRLLSVYKASLREWVLCLRFSPWALYQAPPSSEASRVCGSAACPRLPEVARGCSSAAAAAAAVLCKTQALPGRALRFCQSLELGLARPVGLRPYVARSAAVSALHSVSSYVPTAPTRVFLLATWLKALRATAKGSPFFPSHDFDQAKRVDLPVTPRIHELRLHGTEA